MPASAAGLVGPLNRPVHRSVNALECEIRRLAYGHNGTGATVPWSDALFVNPDFVVAPGYGSRLGWIREVLVPACFGLGAATRWRVGLSRQERSVGWQVVASPLARQLG